MTRPKFIIIPVCVGFVLSFIVGLVSGVSFGIVMFRALIFAILFGVLGFGVGVVFQRFLVDSSDQDAGGDMPAGYRQGSVVDLSIGDEPLEEDENGPDFYVRKEVPDSGGARHSGEGPLPAGGSPSSGGDGAASQVAAQEQFRPVSLGTPAGAGAAEFVAGESAGPARAGGASAGQADDVLPDIGDLSMIPAGEEEEISSSAEMDFAIGNGMETSQGRGNAEVTSDSNTIAQAIRTVLARDS